MHLADQKGPRLAMEKLKGPTVGCTTATCGWRVLLLPQLNRQSLYVYGSEVAVEKECIRQLESGVFVIHPFSPMRYLIRLIDSGQPCTSLHPFLRTASATFSCGLS